ncbi:MAG: carboxypeptidase regulatory-like domain-containing protein [Vicingus serpentipes]|nr:carboxypeptidase regulatory-like domain-containing protein [Vicingus serpentipes]
MLKKLAVLLTVFFTVSITIAQVGQGTIKGKMVDKANGEPLPFANIVVLKGGSQIAGTMTDFDGKYTIPALPPGQYTLQATYVGYQPIKVDNIAVNGGKITFVPDIKASQGAGVDLDEFEVIAYEVPLIDKDQTSSGGTITREDIAKMPGRSAASIAQTVGGVYSQDDGGTGLNIRGARSSSNITYIDGVRVRGTQNLPNSAIEQVAVITGGIPAEYGDATGGVVNITTRGASKEWFGEIEYLTSGFKSGKEVVGLDKFGFNLLAGSVSGPILTKKDSLGNKKDAIMGFFLSGEAKHEVDPRPSIIGDYKVKDEVMEELNANPYVVSSEVGGVSNAANFLRSTDLEKTPFRLNVSRKSLNLAGKIDITTSKTTNVTVGGSFDYRDGNNYSRNFSLLNFQNNSQSIDRTYRVYARFTQRFANSTSEEGEDASLISNAFISFQADIENYNSKTQDREHKDQLSHYGYVGKFTSTIMNPIGSTVETHYVQDPNKHGEVDDTLRDVNGDPVFITGYFTQPLSVSYTFEPGDLNPVLANYNKNYYDFYANTPTGFWDSPTNFEGGGGILNGATSSPISVYSMFTPMGVQSNNYSYGNNAQFRISANGSADVKNHAIKIGFQYEQRNDRFYSLAPVGLWRVGRNLVNAQIQQLSYEEGSYTEELGYIDSYSAFTLSQYYDATTHKQFDKNLRKSLGMDEQGLNFIDFDSYGPDVWNIGMFTPDELFTSGSNPISYYGYDHTGKKLSGNPSVDDFFNKKDENGNYTRENPSFRPIYVAGYIQDKFAFDDLIFNVGVRIDRYDANQSVLKDQYSLFPVKTVGEVELDNPIAQKPSNIGDDFVVYVTDAAQPTVNDVVGYRDGDTWYNAKGEEISNPAVLSSSGIPQPWLVDTKKKSAFEHLDGESFKDFEPQVNISPRIAFSFPISDEALFFAHYDVLTQRPSGGNRMDLISYLNFGQGGYRPGTVNTPFNNPDLKSEQTIDYELGFQQKLSNYSVLKIAAFYREMRDQIQFMQVVGAYPGNYYTYGNRDFGTVKGMTFSFDLRRKGNVSLRASYTLQFADGTGSNSSTSSALVASGYGNLRTLIPLSYDQRHAFVLTGDYRYGEGKNYTGPVLFGKNILQNTGLNIIYRAGSGTPYTRSSGPNGGGVLFSTVGTSNIKGQFNASRLSWSTTVDAKLDRTINLKWGKGEGEDRKEASLNIYIQVLNVLNAKNILGVYSATGNADDDGFLASPLGQQTISQQQDQQSYQDLYAAKMANPFNYALPRRIRLGVQLNF